MHERLRIRSCKKSNQKSDQNINLQFTHYTNTLCTNATEDSFLSSRSVWVYISSISHCYTETHAATRRGKKHFRATEMSAVQVIKTDI